MADTKRFLGLELAGAKNQKTTLAVLEYYPKEKKIFLLDIYDKIVHAEHQSGDQALLELISELKDGVQTLGVNVPLEFPPCMTCDRKTCPLPLNCTVPAVATMNEIHRKASRNQETRTKVKDFTPYTQRPVELWIRHQVFPQLPDTHLFEIDETMGGNRAPLTARMHFLNRHLHDIPLIEVWPKLSTALLGLQLNLNSRWVSTYRHLENGVDSREAILLALAKRFEIFIYERDMRKISHHLNSFDAFICALTALLSDQNRCVSIPIGFPSSSGWIHYPDVGT